ncbi:MAG: hypothetical protein CBB68_10830 [Rhodospirillaceae bacterium TMED8]|nr:histidine kinase [Magnetovibrio sp.]OUT49901.1 MAG: hypothetical protein CBB68_10830 [Rhodospirillaceae bacterium TMED8]
MDLPSAIFDLDPAQITAAGSTCLALVFFISWLVQRTGFRRLKRERDRLKGVATRAREIIATAPDGIFLWDHILGGITCSSRLAVLLSLEAGTKSRYDDIREKFKNDSLMRLERHVSALRGNGSPFDILVKMDERVLQAVGARAETDEGQSVADIVWMRDVTLIHAEHENMHSAMLESNKSGLDDRHLTALLDALPFPIWLRDSTLELAFVNLAGDGIVDVDPSMAERARGQGTMLSERRLIDRDGVVSSMDITEVPLGNAGALNKVTGGTVGYGVPRTANDDVEGDRKPHPHYRHDILEALGSAAAIFSSDKRLEFFTHAYAELWELDTDWLRDCPGYGEILEKLRENRNLPEVPDFRVYKSESLAVFDTVDKAIKDVLHLPDGRTISRITTPIGGGGLAFSFENMSDQLKLERAINELNAVQKETLDNLHEGVAVYGSDGKLKLFNPAFVRLWDLDGEVLLQGPHIHEVLDQTRNLVPAASGQKSWTDEAWQAYLDLTKTSLMARNTSRGKCLLTNDTVIDYTTVPLPDGAVLLSYLDVTDSARVEDSLRQQAVAYREADKMKSGFIANVSHEVRTPMNTIIGFADMLRQDYFGGLNSRQQEYADGILMTSQGLVSIIGDILDLASIEAGQLELQRDTFDIHAMLVGALNLVQDRARRRELSVTFDCPPDIGWMVGDERRLKQVIFNLLSNAITFTPERGDVRLSAERYSEQISISITDTGAGIPTESRERVFLAFEKVGNPKVTDAADSGVGLGLTIVKSFVERHQGKVEIRSQPGRGTTVICRLPAGQRIGEATHSDF